MKKVFSPKHGRRVFVALSGGVDSSVATLLLKNKGFDVHAAFIRGYNLDGCQDRDLEDARQAAQKIGVPFYVFDFADEYKKRVVDYLLDGYRNGTTPNPDIICNSQIKFGLFFDEAMKMGADFVASGHYTRIKREFRIWNLEFRNWLKKRENHIYAGKDNEKDQSYFLWQVPYDRFEKILFPIGDLKKSQVREIAKKAGLPTADKKDSQGVCFLGKFKFDEFLKENIKPKKGDIVDTKGNKVGEHDGVWFYTIGQKHGFQNTSGRSFYVVKKDIDKNILVVAYDGEDILEENKISISKLNFLDKGTEEKFLKGKEIKIFARTRYRQPLMLAHLLREMGGVVQIIFNKKEKIFSASGQSAVFYSKSGQMLGGGIITNN